MLSYECLQFIFHPTQFTFFSTFVFFSILCSDKKSNFILFRLQFSILTFFVSLFIYFSFVSRKKSNKFLLFWLLCFHLFNSTPSFQFFSRALPEYWRLMAKWVLIYSVKLMNFLIKWEVFSESLEQNAKCKMQKKKKKMKNSKGGTRYIDSQCGQRK